MLFLCIIVVDVFCSKKISEKNIFHPPCKCLYSAIPLLSYMEEEEKTDRKNVFSLLLFLLLFVPIALPVEIMRGTVYFISLDFLAKLFALMTMYVYLFIIAIRNLKNLVAARKVARQA